MTKGRAVIPQPINFSLPTPEPSRKGRPSPLTDDQLWHRRDRLIQHFSSNWFKYGWDLRRVRNSEQVRAAFADTEHTYNADLLAPLRIQSQVDFSSLNDNRRKAHALRQRLRGSYEAREQIRELWDAVRHGITSATAHDLRELKDAYDRLSHDWNDRNAEYEWLNKADDDLRVTIHQQEAAFAQSQLLLFIRDRTYAFNPVNLGMALAGSPYMTYRQSLRRCKRAKSHVAEPAEYDIFNAIRYLCSQGELRLSLEELAGRVTLLPRRFRFARSEFAHNLYFLSKALKYAISSTRNTQQLPFVITAAYFRFLGSQNILDRIRNYESRTAASLAPSLKER